MMRAAWAVFVAAATACGEPRAASPTTTTTTPTTTATATRTTTATATATAAATATDAGVPDAAVTTCAFAAIDLTAIVPCTPTQQAPMLANKADVDLKLTAVTPRVAPRGKIVVEVRITNVSSGPLTIPFGTWPPYSVILDAQKKQIDPPPPPTIIRNPQCAAVDCAPESFGPRNQTFVILAAGGVATGKIELVAERRRYAGPVHELCCGGTTATLVFAGPLALGKYTVRANVLGVPGIPGQAETEIEVAK
jgi:hypothetical protein